MFWLSHRAQRLDKVAACRPVARVADAISARPAPSTCPLVNVCRDLEPAVVRRLRDGRAACRRRSVERGQLALPL